MPAFVQTIDVNEILSLQRWCTRRQCEYHSSSGPWHEGEVIPLQPGEGLQITITQQPIHEDHDGLGLMQTSCSSVRDDIRGTYSLHRDRWLVDVAEIFHDHQTTELAEEGPIIYIWTWFINHQTSSRCRVPRALRLLQDPSHWLQEVMALWPDVFQPGDDTLIQIIHPQPVQAGLRIDTPHLMIEQSLVRDKPQWSFPHSSMKLCPSSSCKKHSRSQDGFLHQTSLTSWRSTRSVTSNGARPVLEELLLTSTSGMTSLQQQALRCMYNPHVALATPRLAVRVICMSTGKQPWLPVIPWYKLVDG